ncbi:S24 family peptidase [Aliarcobacter cibarius]|uniref:S24 family peptidase n=1 Tax=Aliarcobacter cibarius TaxID=255507 RepID=A0ABY2V568_9BACT|nr:S24 family peptidase [Aliarcobacter cibarius]TLS99925.1 S24 family peptidase [Aliarcobacter cibarius]TLT00334.1 S24 family peptidase [Aliarcobacter cibarius]
MLNIYECLLRIEKLYKCTKSIETAKLLNLQKTTFYNNRSRAEEEYKTLKKYETETEPFKKDLLSKQLFGNKNQRQHANTLIQAFIDLATRDNLNLNWIFYGQLPIKNNNEDKIGKIVEKHFVNDHLNKDTIAIPFYTNIKASAGSGYINEDNEDNDFIVLPKSMVEGSKKLNAIRVYGDSMAPNIKQDSIILIDIEKKALKNNLVYAVRYENEVFVKRVEDIGDSILLKSDNVQYNTIIAKKTKTYIIGQVITSIQNKNID